MNVIEKICRILFIDVYDKRGVYKNVYFCEDWVYIWFKENEKNVIKIKVIIGLYIFLMVFS